MYIFIFLTFPKYQPYLKGAFRTGFILTTAFCGARPRGLPQRTPEQLGHEDPTINQHNNPEERYRESVRGSEPLDSLNNRCAGEQLCGMPRRPHPCGTKVLRAQTIFGRRRRSAGGAAGARVWAWSSSKPPVSAWLGDGVGEYRLPTEVIAVGRRQYMFTYIHTYAYERYIYIYIYTK